LARGTTGGGEAGDGMPTAVCADERGVSVDEGGTVIFAPQ
jgi:hypothetical protein